MASREARQQMALEQLIDMKRALRGIVLAQTGVSRGAYDQNTQEKSLCVSIPHAVI